LNKKNNLKTIVLWWVGTFIALILIVFNTIFYQMLKYSFYEKIKNSLIIVSNNVKDNFTPPSKNKIVTIPPRLDYPISPVMIAIFASNMKIIAKSIIFMDINLENYIKQNREFLIINNKTYGKIAIHITKIIKPINGYIIVATPLFRIDLKLQDIFIKMIILNPILLILLLLGVNIILDRILNPIKEITKAANEISVGDLDRIIPIPAQNDEIKELVLAFNSMVIRLRNGIDMIHRFNSDVSHELRTPLTVLKGEMQLALRKDRDIDYYKQVLQKSLKEIDYMIDMVEEMLMFSKIDSEIEQKENVKLDELLLKVVSKLSFKAKYKNVKIEFEKREAIDIKTNPFLINAIFINIIDNAIKYSKKDGVVKISLYKDDGYIIFEVMDTGIGIKKEDLKYLTDRFYRSDISRNRNIKGFGLGLSIVKKALDTIGGKIKFDSILDKGTIVTIKIKKDKK
jgi:signal transduction histidine kinase